MRLGLDTTPDTATKHSATLFVKAIETIKRYNAALCIEKLFMWWDRFFIAATGALLFHYVHPHSMKADCNTMSPEIAWSVDAPLTKCRFYLSRCSPKKAVPIPRVRFRSCLLDIYLKPPFTALVSSLSRCDLHRPLKPVHGVHLCFSSRVEYGTPQSEPTRTESKRIYLHSGVHDPSQIFQALQALLRAFTSPHEDHNL